MEGDGAGGGSELFIAVAFVGFARKVGEAEDATRRVLGVAQLRNWEC